MISLDNVPPAFPTVADLISEQVSVVGPPWLVGIGTVLLPMDQESGLAEMLSTPWIVLNSGSPNKVHSDTKY